MPPPRRRSAVLTTDDDDEFDRRESSSTSMVRYKDKDKKSTNENFKVVIRVRPPAPRELEGEKPFYSIVRIPQDDDHTSITIIEHLDTEDGRGGVYSSQHFTFDRVYEESAQQKDVYENTARPAVEAVLAGYNATMIAYGQTGTGKTYTMEGVGKEKGIIPRATEDIFEYIKRSPENKRFQVRASYMQIYNEVISDLLRPCAQGLSVREGKDKGVYVKQLSSWPVRSPQEICSLMERGGRERVTGNTKMSELSSRSHAIFRIVVCETTMEGEGEDEQVAKVKVGQLNIVDLAGSEKVRQTGATGQRLEESKYINKSLSHLGNVIAALTSKDPGHLRQHVPYRDSKLTRILEDSLGGNCKTTMIATISPAPESYTESLSTLKYANRAKNIKNEAVVNEDIGQKGLIKKYERELERLREQLNSVLEERKQTAAAAAQGPFLSIMGKPGEAPSADPNASLSSQGKHPQFKDAIHKVSAEYMAKLDALDKERQVIEEDKAQVDRYKQLLLKQRDIMIALTARLNERDESILSLQEELDAYDQQQKLMEDALDQRTEAMLRASICPKCKSQSAAAAAAPPGTFSQSSNHLRREMIAGHMKWLIEDAPPEVCASSPSLPDNAEYYLTSEEKVHELFQTVSQLRQELALQPPNIRHRLQEAQEEKTAMEYLVKERLQSMVQSVVGERVAAYKREVEQWRSRHQLAEERLRNAEYTLELSRLDGAQGDFHARMKDIINKEVATIKVPYEERLNAIKRDLDAKEAEKRHAVKEGERLQFELFTIKRRYSIPDTSTSNNMTELNRLWQKVQQSEQEAKKCDRLPFIDVSNSQSDRSSPTVANNKITLLERQVQQQSSDLEQANISIQQCKDEADAAHKQTKVLQQQLHQVQQQQSQPQVSQREVLGLQRALATHTKDREALKAIMESKIKPKIDTISTLVHTCYLPSAGTEQRSRLDTEVLQLQNLVNRSIQAIQGI
ncbi:Kinesin-like protein [Diplonema papillatum]|nr:Kinesin-like protein [Diplonema papillatum]